MYLYIQEHLTFYVHNKYTYGIRNKEYTNMSQQLKMCTLYSMNKQYVKGEQKLKRAYKIKKK